MRFRGIGKALLIGLASLTGAGAILAVADNYLATVPGSGTSFGSHVIGGVNYAAMLIVDYTTPTQGLAINASGQAAIQAPPSLPLPTGAATSALQTTGNTTLTTINTTLGSPMQTSGGSVTANAGTNLNTSALATSANQATNGATTAHTCSTGGYSELGCLGQIDDDVKGSIPAGTNLIGKVGIDQTTDGTTNGVRLTSQYPSGATPITASATGTTAATTATLAGASSVTTYICGFSIRANATAAATANSTVTGTITGTLNFTQWTAPAASGIGITEMIFTPCVPASATNTGIAVVSAAPGSGGVVSSTAWGYQK